MANSLRGKATIGLAMLGWCAATAASAVTVTDTTVSDFSAGTVGACAVAEVADGEVVDSGVADDPDEHAASTSTASPIAVRGPERRPSWRRPPTTSELRSACDFLIAWPASRTLCGGAGRDNGHSPLFTGHLLSATMTRRANARAG